MFVRFLVVYTSDTCFGICWSFSIKFFYENEYSGYHSCQASAFDLSVQIRTQIRELFQGVCSIPRCMRFELVDSVGHNPRGWQTFIGLSHMIIWTCPNMTIYSKRDSKIKSRLTEFNWKMAAVYWCKGHLKINTFRISFRNNSYYRWCLSHMPTIFINAKQVIFKFKADLTSHTYFGMLVLQI